MARKSQSPHVMARALFAVTPCRFRNVRSFCHASGKVGLSSRTRCGMRFRCLPFMFRCGLMKVWNSSTIYNDVGVVDSKTSGNSVNSCEPLDLLVDASKSTTHRNL